MLMLLAGSDPEGGHLLVARAAEEWLPLCLKLLEWGNFDPSGQTKPPPPPPPPEVKGHPQSKPHPPPPASSVFPKAFIQAEVAVPVCAILKYLSYLSSAVQLATNMDACTERRNLAQEPDRPLQVSGEGCEGVRLV